MNVTELFGVTETVPTVLPSSFVTSSVSEGLTTGMLGLLASTPMIPETTTAANFWNFRKWLGNLILKKSTSTSAMHGSFLQGFIASLSFIVVSEIGDKTFFIAAIMAMKHPRLVVFAGAISALVFMTILSAAFGSIATIIPRVYTYYASAILFAIFGIKMLRDGWKMDPNEGQEELEEVQMELKRREDQEDKDETIDMLEQGQVEQRRRRRKALCKVFLQAASLTFVAEWGDRSQLTTVVLATREDVFGVIVGGSLGHALCTGGAVIGGRMLAQKISVRTVTIIGGLVFLFFAVSALFIDPSD